jgi:hypothetical protein
VRRFIDDDPGYLDWLAANPRSFVINSARNPAAAHMVLHRAKCGTIGGVPSRGSHWTTRSVKLGGDQNELETFAREASGNEPRRCGLCLRGSASDREHEAPSDPGHAKEADAAPEAPVSDTDSSESVLTGPEAKAAARLYMPWFWSGLALAAVTLISGWLLWHRSAEQLSFLGIGYSALYLAALVWCTRTIGFSYWTSNTEVNFRRFPSPVPRGIATPVLAAAGLCFILAATPTGIGSAFSPAAAASIVVWQFGQATWEALLTIAFLGIVIAALFSREVRAGAGCLLAILAVFLVVGYVVARYTGMLHQDWNTFLKPFRDMWHLLGG